MSNNPLDLGYGNFGALGSGPALIVSSHRRGFVGGHEAPWDEVPESIRFRQSETALFDCAEAGGTIRVVSPPLHCSPHAEIYYEVVGVFKQDRYGRRGYGYIMALGEHLGPRDRFFVRALDLTPTTTTLIVREWRQNHGPRDVRHAGERSG